MIQKHICYENLIKKVLSILLLFIMAHNSYDSDVEDIDTVDCTVHDKLSYAQIEELRTLFKNKGPFNFYEFRQALSDYFNINMTNKQYMKMFFKINLDSDNLITWDEFVSYLIFSFKQDDPHSQKESLILPISMEPVIKNGCHKTPIIGISLIQSLVDDDEESFGSYLTVSKDGFINFWSPELGVTKSGTSKSQYLKYTSTWVLGIAALSDVRVICVSSTERELRFYDVMATNFHLRLVIRSVPHAISKMHYFYTTSQDDINSKLFLGDMNGSVNIIEFSPKLRGPFQSKAGSMLMEFTWHELLKKKFPAIIAKEYLNLFGESITDINYSLKFDTLYACAEGHGYAGGLLAIDNRGQHTTFHIPEGVTSFAIDECNRMLITGGPDAYVRLWDPFLSTKARAILSGHHAGIIYLFIQVEETKCYSIDRTKIIKVWHLIDLTLLQTFGDLNTLISNETSLSYLYNKAGRELLVGGRKLTSVKCCLKMKMDLTDGNTHTAAISVVLYNNLFENIVTCGLDSYIIVWDIWTGKRQVIMKGCHTEDAMGEIIDIAITAATFDPARQFLLTGARDGSLKVWNYNDAVCTRNMHIEKGCEVTAVIWINDRILAVGWNHRVTEFADTLDGHYSDSKQWYKLHSDDITAAAYKVGETLVTGSHEGELILWKIETGQPYRKYEVYRPTNYIPLIIDPKATNPEPKKQQELNLSRLARHSVSKLIMTSHYGEKSEELPREKTEEWKKIAKKKRLRRLDSRGVEMPLPPVRQKSSDEVQVPKLCIQQILFLKARPQTKDHGTILVSLDNGYIQVYSHHQLGGYMHQFYTIHKSGDYCLSLATDKSNKYLFTGSALGYIKIWLLQNYCIPELEHTHVCKPLLRLKFLFLRNDRILGRAKRVSRNKEPLLLNSYKAHLSAVTSIVYMKNQKILITGSNDYSVRMWTLGGRYLGTLGGSLPTKPLKRGEPVNEDDESLRVPPDINKVGSSTTMKVLSGKIPDILGAFIRQSAETEKLLTKKLSNESKEGFEYPRASVPASPFGSNRAKSLLIKSLKEPLLGKQFKFSECSRIKNKPELDTNLPHIPVYTHLNVHNVKIIERPTTPRKLKTIKNLDFMAYYKGKKGK